MFGARHLRDDRLFECYYADRHGDPVDPPTAEHLTDCPTCSARFADLAELFDTIREEVEFDSDAVFTPERLVLQQHQIARRLEQMGRHARVITFPHPFVKTTGMPSASHSAARWIAAAAAAGLFVGVALGASYRLPTFVPSVRGAAINRSMAPTPALATVGNATEVDVAADDAFLSDLDVALERPHSRELIAFDALTPHVREVGTIR